MEKYKNILLLIYLLVIQSQVYHSSGSPQNRQQSIGGVVNSFLGAFIGGNNQGNIPVYWDNQHQNYQRPTGGHQQPFWGQPTGSIHYGPFHPQNGGGCNHNNGGCQHFCRQHTGHRHCYCEDGYTIANDGVSCFDLDECSFPEYNVCSDICTNTDGSFICACSGGGILQSDGVTCSFNTHGHQTTPITDSCQNNNGGCEQKCRDRKGFVKCKCFKGYNIANDGVSCIDINECASPGVCPGSCQNTPGSYICDGGDSPISCEVNNGGCEQKCKYDRRGIAKCKCNRQHQLAQDGRSCIPIGEGGGGRKNPCSRNNGGCHHNCLVENGHKVCTCNAGYELVKEKKCRPIEGQIDPCATVRCHHECENQNGRPVCVCRPGYYLEKGICVSKDTPGGPFNSCSSTPSTLPPGCGSSRKTPPSLSVSVKVVGGRVTKPEDWPWMAGIMKKSSSVSFCGGVLIYPQFIMTAAHCLSTFKENEIKVRLGEHDFGNANDNCPEDHDVLAIIRHESYNQITNENDIALIKMTTPTKYNKFVQPVCLPLPSYNPDSKPGYVIGWGTTAFLGDKSNVLREAALRTWTRQDCMNSYPNKIYPTMICAGSGTVDSCQGDSGGPYMHFSGGRWMVIGLVSWGEGCATENRPGVYTYVNKYLTWIKSHSQ